MKHLMILSLSLALLSPSAAWAGDKYGLLARDYLTATPAARLFYTAGVADLLTWLNMACPRPPSYAEIMSRTDAAILANPQPPDQRWAAPAIMDALTEIGCIFQPTTPAPRPAARPTF
jgi:hypothetical protein